MANDKTLILSAFAAFVGANLIHNGFGLDVAVIPSAVLVAIHLWRPRPWSLLGAALFIALPGLAFLKFEELFSPSSTIAFWNHVLLLLAALLAIGATAFAFLQRHQPSHD